MIILREESGNIEARMIGRMEPNPELEESIYAGGYTHNKA
jgi:hypothetical protein